MEYNNYNGTIYMIHPLFRGSLKNSLAKIKETNIILLGLSSPDWSVILEINYKVGRLGSNEMFKCRLGEWVESENKNNVLIFYMFGKI